MGVPVLPEPIGGTCFREQIAQIGNQCAGKLGIETRLSPESVVSMTGYAGPEYAVPTEASLEAIRMVAATEATVLDPVYTGKAMPALIDDNRGGLIGRDRSVVSSTQADRSRRRPIARTSIARFRFNDRSLKSRFSAGSDRPGNS